MQFILVAISQFSILIGQKVQLTGFHNSNEMRHAWTHKLQKTRVNCWYSLYCGAGNFTMICNLINCLSIHLNRKVGCDICGIFNAPLQKLARLQENLLEFCVLRSERFHGFIEQRLPTYGRRNLIVSISSGSICITNCH